MNPTEELLASSLPLRFDLKSLLLAVTGIAILIAPVHWFGRPYVVSVACSISLVVSCVLAYRSQHRATSMGVAAVGMLLGFFTVIGLLVFFFHAVLNLVANWILLTARVRPRVFAVGLSVVAVAVYGFSFWSGAAAMRELHVLKLRYPFESLEERLAFERNVRPVTAASGRPAPVSQVVAANLDELDDQLEARFYRRSWALRELHEYAARHFARAAGFGFMRMPGVSEYALQLEARPEVKLPLPIDLAELNPPTAELSGKHRLAVLDFVEPDRLGYVRTRKSASGFEAHGFSALPEEITEGKRDARWQVVRLELVSLVRHAEPRVYVAEVLPQMDQLDDVPHRALNAFEQAALPKLATNEDVVVDTQPEQIQMLGALRAGKKCMECHEGERGTLLGAFSYAIKGY